MKKLTIITILAGISMFVFVLVVIGFLYTGGIGCFLSPRNCAMSNSDIIVPTQHPIVTPQPAQPTGELLPTPTQFSTPTPSSSPTPTGVPVSDLLDFVVRIEEQNLNCGKDPYGFNGMSKRWQRRFNRWCYDYTGFDPFEVIFEGLDYGEVIELLVSAQLSDLPHDEQILRLSEMGLWDYSCQCVP